jgi:hypothetical protein
MSKVGRPIVSKTVRASGVIPDVSTTQNSNKNESTNNIFLQVFGGTSAEVSESHEVAPQLAPILIHPPVEPAPEPATADPPAELELKDLDADLVDNAKLKRFRAKRADNLELTIDVLFLKHLIHVLIENHSLAITAIDIHDIMAFFDSKCEVRTTKRRVMEREVGEPTCCGTTAHEREVVIETIAKIIVGGLNIIKTAPDFITFLADLGVNL